MMITRLAEYFQALHLDARCHENGESIKGYTGVGSRQGLGSKPAFVGNIALDMTAPSTGDDMQVHWGHDSD